MYRSGQWGRNWLQTEFHHDTNVKSKPKIFFFLKGAIFDIRIFVQSRCEITSNDEITWPINKWMGRQLFRQQRSHLNKIQHRQIPLLFLLLLFQKKKQTSPLIVHPEFVEHDFKQVDEERSSRFVLISHLHSPTSAHPLDYPSLEMQPQIPTKLEQNSTGAPGSFKLKRERQDKYANFQILVIDE